MFHVYSWFCGLAKVLLRRSLRADRPFRQHTNQSVTSLTGTFRDTLCDYNGREVEGSGQFLRTSDTGDRFMATWKNAVPEASAQFDRKREVLIREAAASFNRRGYYGTSLTEIAKKLGVTKAALYT